MLFDHLSDKLTVFIVRELLYKLMPAGFIDAIFYQFIAYTVVLKRHYESVHNGIPKAKLIRHVLIEEAEDVFAVHTLRSGRNAQKELRLEIVQNLSMKVVLI